MLVAGVPLSIPCGHPNNMPMYTAHHLDHTITCTIHTYITDSFSFVLSWGCVHMVVTVYPQGASEMVLEQCISMCDE